MHSHTVALSILAAVGCTACLPIPHIRTTRPAVHGYLTSMNVPVAGAEILYSSNWQESACSNPEDSVYTDEKGAFSFEAKRHFWFLVALLPLHCAQSWSLCIRSEHAEEVLWRGGGYGPCTAPWELHIDCEISRTEPQPVPDLSTPYSNWPTCRYRNLASHEVAPPEP